MFHVDHVTVMFPAYVCAYIGRFFRDIHAVRTTKPRQLSAFKLQMRVEIVLPAEGASTLWTGKLVPIFEYLQVAQMQ